MQQVRGVVRCVDELGEDLVPVGVVAHRLECVVDRERGQRQGRIDRPADGRHERQKSVAGEGANHLSERADEPDEKEDADRTARIMKALPDAFLYQPDGTEVGKERLGKPGDELVRLKFRPNPRYTPPSRVELVLTGMEGTLLIDANQHRLARIDGKLVKEGGFGWGILGHLNPGGHFLVDQSDVGYNRWEVTHMDLAITGKLLFFKSLNIRSNETYSNFRPAPPNLTFAQAVELLKKEEAVVAQNYFNHENQQK